MTTTDRDETFTLMHRSNFLGTPADDPALGRVNRWEYRGMRWSATRPADGEPPMPVTVRCSECDEPVEMLVRSHSGTRRIRATFRWAAVGFAVLAVLAVVLTGTAIFAKHLVSRAQQAPDARPLP